MSEAQWAIETPSPDSSKSVAAGSSMGRLGIWVSIVACILAIVSAASVLNTILKNAKLPFAWDSAGHAWEGLIIARDFLCGDILSLAADTWRQAWWPFFHSWLLAPAFIFLGNTYVAARILSLICFLGFLITSHLIACELSKERGPWVGLITIILASTSLPILTLSAMSMTEIPALFFCSLSLLFYMKALRCEKACWLIGASLSMAAAFFTQTHLGLFLIGAILLTQATGKHKILSSFNKWLWGPALLIAVFWFADSRHILLFYSHSTFQPEFYKFWSMENWLFYPHAFLFSYHPVVWEALAIAMGFFVSLARLRDPAVRVLFFNVLVGFVLMIFKLDHRMRYIITIVPCLWLLGSLGITDIALFMTRSLKKPMKRAAVLTTAGVLCCILLGPSVMARYRNYAQFSLRDELWCDERQGKAYEFIADNVSRDCNHFSLFTSFDYYNSLKSPTIRWNLEVQRFRTELATKEKKQRVLQYSRDLLHRRDTSAYRRLEEYLRFRNVNVYEYHLLSFVKALDVNAYQSYRKSHALNPFSDKIADVNDMDPRVCCLILIFKDGEDPVNRYAAEFLAKHPEWRVIASRHFDDLGVEIMLYGKNARQAFSGPCASNAHPDGM
jgi:hypothetical protein